MSRECGPNASIVLVESEYVKQESIKVLDAAQNCLLHPRAEEYDRSDSRREGNGHLQNCHGTLMLPAPPAEQPTALAPQQTQRITAHSPRGRGDLTIFQDPNLTSLEIARLRYLGTREPV